MSRQPGSSGRPDQDVARALGGMQERERQTQLAAAMREPGIRSRQRTFAVAHDEVQLTSAAAVNIGPTVELKVPDPGAFVWVIGHVEARNPPAAQLSHVWVEQAGGASQNVALIKRDSALNIEFPFVSDPELYIASGFDHSPIQGASSPLIWWVFPGLREFYILASGGESDPTGQTTTYGTRRLAVGLW